MEQRFAVSFGNTNQIISRYRASRPKVWQGKQNEPARLREKREREARGKVTLGAKHFQTQSPAR